MHKPNKHQTILQEYEAQLTKKDRRSIRIVQIHEWEKEEIPC